jgi:hypothetical protein
MSRCYTQITLTDRRHSDLFPLYRGDGSAISGASYSFDQRYSSSVLLFYIGVDRSIWGGPYATET